MNKKIIRKLLLILILLIIPGTALIKILFFTKDFPLFDKDTDTLVLFFLIVYFVILYIIAQLRADAIAEIDGTYEQRQQEKDRSYKWMWGRCPKCNRKVNTFTNRCPHCTSEI